MNPPIDPMEPEVGAECPECEGAELRAGHLVDSARVWYLDDAYTRQRELHETRVVYCPDCWKFWTKGHT